MKLRYWLLCLFVFVPMLIVAAFLIITSMPVTYPPGVELNVSESISPKIGVFVLDNNKNMAKTLGTNEWFFLKQKGLAEGTIYGFRILDENGNIVKPVYETFIAKSVDWLEPNKYYHNLAPGKYTIEVLTIKGGNGIVVARTDISIFDSELERANLEKAVKGNCSSLMAEPTIDANGWSRESKIADCAGKVAAEFKNPDACNSVYPLFNLTMFGYEDCIRAYALATVDVSACDRLGMPKSVGFCKARATKDWTECRKISCDISCTMENLDTQQNLCIQWYAIENHDAALCNEITSTAYNMKEICFNLTAK